ncbi:amino acid adenylation domain-containing protein [Dokdonia sp.]|uniref:amino acid adenylation domain-containing protein n=1 Tax=Dokdonia sp. TaxID=2024995 RepID=UPI003264E2B9
MIENLIHTLQSLKIGLKVVDGSLKINAPKGVLTTEVIESIKAQKNELIALLSSSESIPKAKEREYYALTSAQQRLWTLSQFEAGNTAYNIFNAFQFNGVLNIEKMSLAFIKLIERHESLRTIFKEDKHGELGQYIVPLKEYTGALQFVDLSNATDQALKNHSDVIQRHRFDLERGPLFIGEIVKVSNEKHILMFNMHHIIGDGWSMEILNKEFALLYNGLSTGQEVVLSELPIQYKDYSEWQNSETRQTVLGKSKTFWLDTFAGDLPVLELPSHKMRPKVKTYNGSSFDYSFSKEFTLLLNAYAQQNGVTLFMVLMTGLNGVLSRYANTRDIILGTPIAGREHADLENQVGLYLNTLAIRTRFEETSSFEELIAIQKETLLQAYSHQEYPFDSLVEELNIKRDLSRSVLFDALVVFQNQQELLALDGLTLNGVEISSYKNIEKTFSKFDISFVFSEVDGRIYLNLGYNTDIYTLHFIQQIIVHLENFLEIGISNPKGGINTIDFLSEREKQQLLIDFNATQTAYPKEETVVDLFLNQVRDTPDEIAIQCKGREITYRELDTLSNQLASYIVSNNTVSKGNVISIQLEKSEWFIISILAVLKTGNAYLPIDVHYPEERISYITSDSNCKFTIDEEFITTFKESDIRSLEEFTVVSSEISDLMYVIYTSGSTGKPKGVLVTYGSLINYILHQSKTYDLGKSERILQFSNLAFDASVEQVFLALLHGASLIIVSKDLIIDTPNFAEVLKENEITHFHATPSYISKIEKLESCTDIRRIVCGGEPCPKDLAARLSIHVDFYNKYGPTETTISSTIYKYDSNQSIGQSVPIGKPIANTEIYILSDTLEVQPLGVIGELCIAGDGVSNGYFNKPELTAESFVENRFRESGNLYKTGDLAKWLPDGNIEYIGRKDDQVKIRGYRIELGEIENNLIGIASIDQAVVIDRTIDGEKILVAYITGEEELDKQEIRATLSTELPEYMIPSYYVVLDSIPLTAHGKIDKRALPAIAQEDILKREYVAPITPIQKQLVRICEEILKVDTIGITDNFFELGGHSLKMILIVNKIKKELGLELSVKDIFLHPTISGMASQVKRGVHTKIPRAIEQESYVLTSSQRRLWVLSQFEEGSVAYNIPGVYELKGAINIDLFNEAFRVLIERHESLRTCFKQDDQEEVRQYILPVSSIEATIQIHDLIQIQDQDSRVATIINANYTHSFDLSNAPLITSSLIKLASNHCLLVLNMHHIISDGWSMEVISKEFMMIYDALQKGKRIVLPVLSIQYKDYSEWLAKEEQQAKLSISEEYWLHTFSGELPILELPTLTTRPKIKTYNGDSVTYQFSENLSNRLQAFSKQQEVSLFMLLMSGVNGLLSRYTKTQDIVLGTPVAGREHADLEHQIGLYLHTLAIRTSFESTTSFEELLAIQKDTLLQAYSHQDYPFDSLVEALDLQHNTSRSALFDIIVVLQNQQDLFSSTSLSLEGLEILPYTGNHRKVSQFDLSFIFSEGEGQLSLHIEYNTDIYEVDFIERLCVHFDTFLARAIQNPTQKLTTINYLSPSEESQLLVNFNATSVDYPAKTLVDLFLQQVEKTPEVTALVFGDTTYTYRELDELSNEFAHYLLSTYDLSVEDLVGVKLDRDEWLLISLLAVLKSGCAYVPIDPNYPSQRIAYIEQDSQCKVTIDQEVISSFTNTVSISKELPEITLDVHNLAYIIYTSGSTGKPKGVMITHKNASSMLHWSEREFGDTDFEVLYAVTSHCFDLSVYEFFYPLSIGKSLRLLSNGLSISDYLDVDTKVLLNTVPSVVQALIEKEVDFSNVIAINLAGEPFPTRIAAYFKDSGIILRNLYGPSEDTTYSSYYRVVGTYERSVPIGKGIDNTQFYILSDALTLQPLGVIGEICISGDGLSRGYLHQPELTDEKFIMHPFKEGERIYRTGDLGRWLSDGTIEYIGRKDSQVKIRGHRIELGEIEHVLQSQDAIDQCVVVTAKVEEDLAIVSYIVSKDAIDKQELRLSLGQELPAYMLPSYYVFLDEFPLTPNGKIDKKSLPSVSSEDIIKREYVAPRTTIEEKLVAIWEEVLERGNIGVTDNFFELGGHSIKGTKVLSRVNREFNVVINIKNLFISPTIEYLASQIHFIEKQEQIKSEKGLLKEIAL